MKNLYGLTDGDISYMDCWYYIAPLIPVTDEDWTKTVYVKTFHALKEADKRAKEEARKKWTD